jgi:hypothetical protein
VQGVGEHERDAAGDVAVSGSLVTVEHVADIAAQCVQAGWLAVAVAWVGEERVTCR